VEEWFRIEPDITAKTLMHRLCEQFPNAYPTGAHLGTLQHRVQLWRNEQVKRLIFESAGGHVAGSETPSSSQNVRPMTIQSAIKIS